MQAGISHFKLILCEGTTLTPAYSTEMHDYLLVLRAFIHNYRILYPISAQHYGPNLASFFNAFIQIDLRILLESLITNNRPRYGKNSSFVKTFQFSIRITIINIRIFTFQYLRGTFQLSNRITPMITRN